MTPENAKSHFIDHFATTQSTAPRAIPWHAMARLRRNIDLDVAHEMLRSGMKHLGDVEMFMVPAYVRALTLHRDRLPDDLAEDIEGLLANRTSYLGLYNNINTENHKIMYATTRMLAAQAMPDRRIDGVPAAKAYRATLDWLRAWAESRMSYGHAEYHSPMYCMTYIFPFLNLRDCTNDPEVFHMAEMMADFIALHHAVDSLDGMHSGGNSRNYDSTVVGTRGSGPEILNSLWYGDEASGMPVLSNIAYTVADSDYLPPPAIRAAAQDRSKPFGVRERFAEINSNGVPIDIQRYTWMTDAYVMASLQGCAWPDHQNRWCLRVNSEDRYATVLTNHPVNTEKGGLWHGASPYEHLVQHEGSLVATYHIPESDPHQYMKGHLPHNATSWSVDVDTLKGELAPRWICFHSGDAYVAIYPCQPFRIENARYEGEYFDNTGCAGLPYWLIRSEYRRNAAVVQVAKASDWPSFAAFVEAVEARTPEFDGETVTVRYRSLDDTLLEITNPGPRPGAPAYLNPDGTIQTLETHNHYRAQRPDATIRIDGEDPDYVDWPSMECPFAHSEYGSGVYRVGDAKLGLELNFRTWTKQV